MQSTKTVGHFVLIILALLFDLAFYYSYQITVEFAAKNPELRYFVLGDPEFYVNLIVCGMITIFAIRSALKLITALLRYTFRLEH